MMMMMMMLMVLMVVMVVRTVAPRNVDRNFDEDASEFDGCSVAVRARPRGPRPGCRRTWRERVRQRALPLVGIKLCALLAFWSMWQPFFSSVCFWFCFCESPAPLPGSPAAAACFNIQFLFAFHFVLPHPKHTHPILSFFPAINSIIMAGQYG
uniref:Secreted protein n=1 Tax=Anopheles darlingi TaxID=43151 RepID=A0A2M4D5M3_ANODA